MMIRLCECKFVYVHGIKRGYIGNDVEQDVANSGLVASD